ncbi:MAG: type II toxin-antitoxin system VapC family toxin [Actinomycetota bacterium]|nr:type II toxin-antitoxin system VapC family toxin [Actinomycetota bacterium]
MIVIDTTVLVYAKGSDHPYREPCRVLVAAIADGRLQATTTAEVIQEFAHVRARRRGRADAAALARDYGELLSPLLPITADSLRDGLRLFESTERLGAFDAVLAAATTTSGASALVSVDREFAAITALNHVIPDSDGIQRLLANSA